MSHRYAYPIDDENVEMNEREERKWKMYAVGERQMAYPNILPLNEMKRVSSHSGNNDGGDVSNRTITKREKKTITKRTT
jgi:hypothetical protein